MTKEDASWPHRSSFNNHRTHSILTPLLSTSTHLCMVPGLYLSGAACMTSARMVGGFSEALAAVVPWLVDVGVLSGMPEVAEPLHSPSYLPPPVVPFLPLPSRSIAAHALSLVVAPGRQALHICSSVVVASGRQALHTCMLEEPEVGR